jgi:hypothetical protein
VYARVGGGGAGSVRSGLGTGAGAGGAVGSAARKRARTQARRGEARRAEARRGELTASATGSNGAPKRRQRQSVPLGLLRRPSSRSAQRGARPGLDSPAARGVSFHRAGSVRTGSGGVARLRSSGSSLFWLGHSRSPLAARWQWRAAAPPGEFLSSSWRSPRSPRSPLPPAVRVSQSGRPTVPSESAALIGRPPARRNRETSRIGLATVFSWRASFAHAHAHGASPRGRGCRAENKSSGRKRRSDASTPIRTTERERETPTNEENEWKTDLTPFGTRFIDRSPKGAILASSG